MKQKLTFKEAIAYLSNKYSERDFKNLINNYNGDVLFAKAIDYIEENKYNINNIQIYYICIMNSKEFTKDKVYTLTLCNLYTDNVGYFIDDEGTEHWTSVNFIQLNFKKV